MSIADNRIDINKKYPISTTIKFALLILAIFGIYVRGCYIKNQKKIITFSDVKVTEFTRASIDVEFNVTNHSSVDYNKPIFIKILNKKGEEIASKITKIYISPNQKNKGYLIELTKIKNPIKSLDEVGFVVVKLYNPSIF